MAPNTCKCCCYYIADITEGCVVTHIAIVVRLYVYIYIDIIIGKYVVRNSHT